MTFRIETTNISGLLMLDMKQVPDQRGVVRELFRASAWADAGLPEIGPWVQINVTESRRGALRGLHGEAMTKLVAIVSGEALGAYVDVRHGSPTEGAVVTVPLSPGRQVLVPNGVCNGFQTVSEESQYVYCFDREWAPGMPGVAVNALDPALGIRWPVPVALDDPAQISPKDRDLPSLDEISRAGAAT